MVPKIPQIPHKRWWNLELESMASKQAQLQPEIMVYSTLELKSRCWCFLESSRTRLLSRGTSSRMVGLLDVFHGQFRFKNPLVQLIMYKGLEQLLHSQQPCVVDCSVVIILCCLINTEMITLLSFTMCDNYHFVLVEVVVSASAWFR